MNDNVRNNYPACRSRARSSFLRSQKPATQAPPSIATSSARRPRETAVRSVCALVFEIQNPAQSPQPHSSFSASTRNRRSLPQPARHRRASLLPHPFFPPSASAFACLLSRGPSAPSRPIRLSQPRVHPIHASPTFLHRFPFIAACCETFAASARHLSRKSAIPSRRRLDSSPIPSRAVVPPLPDNQKPHQSSPW